VILITHCRGEDTGPNGGEVGAPSKPDFGLGWDFQFQLSDSRLNCVAEALPSGNEAWFSAAAAVQAAISIVCRYPKWLNIMPLCASSPFG